MEATQPLENESMYAWNFDTKFIKIFKLFEFIYLNDKTSTTLMEGKSDFMNDTLIKIEGSDDHLDVLSRFDVVRLAVPLNCKRLSSFIDDKLVPSAKGEDDFKIVYQSNIAKYKNYTVTDKFDKEREKVSRLFFDEHRDKTKYFAQHLSNKNMALIPEEEYPTTLRNYESKYGNFDTTVWSYTLTPKTHLHPHVAFLCLMHWSQDSERCVYDKGFQIYKPQYTEYENSQGIWKTFRFVPFDHQTPQFQKQIGGSTIFHYNIMHPWKHFFAYPQQIDSERMSSKEIKELDVNKKKNYASTKLFVLDFVVQQFTLFVGSATSIWKNKLRERDGLKPLAIRETAFSDLREYLIDKLLNPGKYQLVSRASRYYPTDGELEFFKKNKNDLAAAFPDLTEQELRDMAYTEYKALTQRMFQPTQAPPAFSQGQKEEEDEDEIEEETLRQAALDAMIIHTKKEIKKDQEEEKKSQQSPEKLTGTKRNATPLKQGDIDGLFAGAKRTATVGGTSTPASVFPIDMKIASTLTVTHPQISKTAAQILDGKPPSARKYPTKQELINFDIDAAADPLYDLAKVPSDMWIVEQVTLGNTIPQVAALDLLKWAQAYNANTKKLKETARSLKEAAEKATPKQKQKANAEAAEAAKLYEQSKVHVKAYFNSAKSVIEAHL